MSTTITVNEALVNLDNVVKAANYILEELQTRKDQNLAEENINNAVREKMEDYDYRNGIIQEIRNNYGNGICREVAFYVMERIDADIEAFINARVNAAIQSAGLSASE